jgi:NADPH:quinone reductase-like Zn-dependent oxidoreductase
MQHRLGGAPALAAHSSLDLQPGMRAVITGGTGALGTLLAR